jgi:hypothetical protein
LVRPARQSSLVLSDSPLSCDWVAFLRPFPFKEEVRGSNPLRATDRELSGKSGEDLRAALTVGRALRFLSARSVRSEGCTGNGIEHRYSGAPRALRPTIRRPLDAFLGRLREGLDARPCSALLVSEADDGA